VDVTIVFRLRSTRSRAAPGAFRATFTVMPDLDDQGSQLIETIGDLVDIASEVSPEEALEGFDKTATEVFFRDWPTVRSWGDSLYERMQNDLGGSSLPDSDPKSPETGAVD
jgi:hypothetical protein